MGKLELDRLYDQLGAMTVGFGPLFKDFQVSNNNYPPHDIIKISSTEFLLKLALAGFKRDEIKIEYHQGMLTVKGDKTQSEVPETTQYQYKGIATRNFTKSFQIAEYFEVASATYEDGILTLSFIKNVPEEARPKQIAIA